MENTKSRLIPLTQGKFAIVDEGDFEYLSQWKWYFIKDGYAVRSDYSNGRSPRQVKMHRQIMGEPIDMEVDHKDTDRLNNCRSNLRIGTKANNQQNANISRNNTSGFKGVHKPKRGLGWVVHVQRQYVGYFNTKEDAARAYNRVALAKFGEFARLNNV